MPSFYNDCLSRDENRFFIVDDDSFISSLALTALSGFGQSYEFKDARSLMSDYEEYKPNIVFLDIHLGKTNGIDLLKKLLELDPDAHVYMLSGDSTKENVIKCRKIGAKGFIGKPFARINFAEAIEKCPTITPMRGRKK